MLGCRLNTSIFHNFPSVTACMKQACLFMVFVYAHKYKYVWEGLGQKGRNG